MQTTTRRVSEFFKPAPQTPVSANGLGQGIYFYKPRPEFSAACFVIGKEPNLSRTSFEQHNYYSDDVMRKNVNDQAVGGEKFPAEDAKTFSTFKP